eukprot:UN07841
MTATLCFTLQYGPQAIKNSSTGIIIKRVGAVFLMLNAYLTALPQLYPYMSLSIENTTFKHGWCGRNDHVYYNRTKISNNICSIQ